MPRDESIPTSTVLFEYRGRQYEEHSRDANFPYDRRLALQADWDPDDFPEAITFGDDPADPWVRMGAGAIDAAWIRTVTGRWRECEVVVGRQVMSGPDEGHVVVHYSGSKAAQAHAAGFIEEPYQHWHAIVDPDEVEVTDVVVEPRKWV